MDTVRIVSGGGTGPTATASYDAALADANVHEYNLVHISSIIPDGATVERLESAPELGTPGDRLYVVEARATAREGVTAGLAWAVPESGSGIVYESTIIGDSGATSIESELERGIEAGLELRSVSVTATDQKFQTISHPKPDSGFATAVVLAVFGRGRPILDTTVPETEDE